MNQNSYKVLSVQIEHKRKEMIYLGHRYGLTSPEVIQASQQLDCLLNKVDYLNSPSLLKAI
ncbi:aspartyl-phosphate phosphatase Spo0E family protein [Bacillus sp. OTU530]|uniref:aspartyl-phosphate phosphatase Spo0E family protein n=1 Tax=Bacillus sp. OTU530 TaxID=3043862 RepID=UPI00313C8458